MEDESWAKQFEHTNEQQSLKFHCKWSLALKKIQDMRKLKTWLEIIYPPMKLPLLQHKNAQPYTSVRTTAVIRCLGFNILDHPTYSPIWCQENFISFPNWWNISEDITLCWVMNSRHWLSLGSIIKMHSPIKWAYATSWMLVSVEINMWRNNCIQVKKKVTCIIQIHMPTSM